MGQLRERTTAQERKDADRIFDEAELEVADFSRNVAQLQNTDAFQMMKKIMCACRNSERTIMVVQQSVGVPR